MSYICIISRGYPTKETPMLGIFEMDQAKALRDAGHRVVFVSLDMRSIRRKRSLGVSVHEQAGIRMYNISVPVGNVPYKLFYSMGKWALMRVFTLVMEKEGRPDVMHAHFTDISAIAVCLKEKYKVPLVMTEHSSKMNVDVLSVPERFYGGIAYKAVDRLIVVSKSLQNSVYRHFGVKGEIVHNIVDVDSIMFEPKGHESFRFVLVANLLKHKGIEVVLRSMADMRNREVQLVIVGEGRERENLQIQIKELGIGGRVEMVGYKSRVEMSGILNSCDAFVLASRGETFGVVYIEAMLAGLPVIATRCGGPEDFVDANNGLLVDVDDQKALTDAMDAMVDGIGKYDGRRISEEVRKRFAPAAIAADISKVYEKVPK